MPQPFIFSRFQRPDHGEEGFSATVFVFTQRPVTSCATSLPACLLQNEDGSGGEGAEWVVLLLHP